MAKEKKASQKKHISNSKYHDSSSKLIFGNAELCSQFLRNYMDIPLLKNIRAEDIEDITERYVPMFTEERNSDTVKRIRLSEKDTLFFVSLIEHKTKVDYNVSMQILRYMVYIWEDYEKEMERKKKGISKTKNFRYPPILPIVYYEGSGKWTAPCNIKDRIYFDEAFEPFTPVFFYKLVQTGAYSVDELVEKRDELSLLMLINRLQNSSEFRELNLPEDYLKNLSENSTDELLDIIARVTASMLRHLDLPEEDISDFTDQVKERNMAELFENFVDDIGLIPRLRIARETYIDGLHEEVHEKMRAEDREKVLAEVHEKMRAEAREKVLAEVREEVREKVLTEVREEVREKVLAEVREKVLAEVREEARAEAREEARAEVREKVLAEVREEARAEVREEARAEARADLTRFTNLTQLLLESGRADDLSRAVSDLEYREKLYLQYDL